VVHKFIVWRALIPVLKCWLKSSEITLFMPILLK
jgi:hypothetical protein